MLRFFASRSTFNRAASRSSRVRNIPSITPQRLVSDPRREVRATAALMVFVLSQWVMPQALWVQGVMPAAQAAPPAAPKATAPHSALKSAGGQPKASSSVSGGKTGKATGLGKATRLGDEAPAWYRASRARDNRSTASQRRILLAQGPPAPRVRTIGGALRAEAVSGIPLLRDNFQKEVRRSADLEQPPFFTPRRLDLAGERVPGQGEVTALGGLAGPLSPTAPAEAEGYASKADAQLKEEGFERGLETPFPSPEAAQARSLRAGGALQTLVAAAKHFDETKKLVKKARDENRFFARSMQKWNDGAFASAAQELSDYAKAYPKSPWTAEALIQVANYDKFTGHHNESEELYRQVIESTSNTPGDPSYSVHRKAFGRLTDLYLIEKRYGEVRPMMEDFLNHDTNWRRRTWGLYWLMELNAIGSQTRRMVVAQGSVGKAVKEKGANGQALGVGTKVANVEVALRDCGTRALAALLSQTDHPRPARAVAGMEPSDARGFSLAQLQDISAKQGVPLIGFAATPAQLSHLPLPLLLHLSDEDSVKPKSAGIKTKAVVIKAATAARALPWGHYVLLRSYDARQDRWNVLDAQSGFGSKLSSPQLLKQWSGKGLMLAQAPRHPFASARIPSFASGRVLGTTARESAAVKPAIRLSMRVMATTFGTGYAVQGPGDIGPDCDCVSIGQSCQSCGGGAGGSTRSGGFDQSKGFRRQVSPGEPSASINPITQNVYITDTPIWYSPSKGPSVNISLSYNSLDASNYNTLMGNKWVLNYGTYIATITNGGAPTAIIYTPDGPQLRLNAPSPAGSGGAIAATSTFDKPRGFFATLVRSNATGQYVLTSPGGDQMIYRPFSGSTSTNAFLVEERDRFGQSLTFQNGLVAGKVVPLSITDADGKITRLQYDNLGHLLSVQTPDEKQANFSYDSNGNLIQCVDVAGQPFQYAYDNMAQVTQINTTQGQWNYERQNIDDGYSIATIISNPLGQVESVRFYNVSHGIGRYISTDHRGNVTQYGHPPSSQNGSDTEVATLLNPDGSISTAKFTQITSPSGQVMNRSFGDNRTLAPTTTSQGDLSSAALYNSLGKPTQLSQTVSSGAMRWIEMTYAPNNLDIVRMVIKGQDSPNGSMVTQTVLLSANYDSAHQMLQSTDTTGRLTDMTYTGWGAVATATTYKNGVPYTLYNTYGTSGTSINRVTSVQLDGTFQSSMTYDTSGRVKTLTDARGLTTFTTYNNLDRPIGTFYPDGTSQLTDYTCCALPGMVTDRSGRRSYYDYDALKRLIRTQDADGQTLQFDYDVDGHPTGLLDAKGNRTMWRYDADGRIIQKRYSDGNGESYAYRPSDGLISALTNGRGQTTFYGYNSLNQINAINYPNSPDVSLSYDPLGRPVTMNDASGTTTWTYTDYGRPQSEDGPWPSDTLTYDYDSLGRPLGTSVQRPSGMSDVTAFGYDTLGRIVRVSGNMGDFGTVGSFTTSYVGNTSQMAQLVRPNGVNTNYGYEGADSLRRLIGVSNVSANSGTNLSSFGYSYGSGGAPGGFRDNRVSQTRQYGSEGVQSVSYGYNATSMLTGEGGAAGGPSTPAFSFDYAYDAMGNRTQVSDNTNHTRVDSSYSGLNQLTGSATYDTSPATPALTGTAVFGYDGDGNMAQVVAKDAGGAVTGSTVYGYDDASRLVSITTASNKTEFVYDGLSRLRTSTYSTGIAGNWTVQNVKRRVYKGMDVVQERDGNNVVTASLTRTGNIGGILARSASSGHSYFGYDGNGNVTTLTDTAGAVVGSYTYDAWGKLLASAGPAAAENPYRFSSKESIAGLCYYGFRFYSPGLGRWINRDPIKERGGLNLYAALRNNSLNKVDRDGLSISDYLPTWGEWWDGEKKYLACMASCVKCDLFNFEYLAATALQGTVIYDAYQTYLAAQASLEAARAAYAIEGTWAAATELTAARIAALSAGTALNAAVMALIDAEALHCTYVCYRDTKL